MTREDENRYIEAINRSINDGMRVGVLRALKLLIKEYGLYYDEKPVEEYKDIKASKFLSKLLKDYIILGDYTSGKCLLKTRGTQITHFLIPDEICEALIQKLKSIEQREKAKRQAKIEEEVNTINNL